MTTPRQRHASWRAQYASQHLATRRPRKPVMVHAPVGEPAVNSLASACEAWEEACKCGFVLCAKRGPCAPPASIDWPAPVAAPQPAGARFVVGQRVRTVAQADGLHRCNAGLLHEVIYVGDEFIECTRWPLKPGEYSCRYQYRAAWLEPLPSETPEGGYWVPPGWTCNGGKTLTHEATGVVAFPRSFGGFWFGNSDADLGDKHRPTLAQACCAALGIEIDRDEDERLYTPFFEGNCIAPGIFLTAEAAARSALAALHARGMR